MKSKEDSLPNQVKNQRTNISTSLQKMKRNHKSKQKQWETKKKLAFEFYEEKRLQKTKKLSNY